MTANTAMRKISLTTDLTIEGEQAFYSALALAVANRARLEILHVSRPGQHVEWSSFPRVRDVLERWGLLPPHSAQEEVHQRLGVEVGKIEIHSNDAASGISDFIEKHTPDLLVAASHGRFGLNWFLTGSVAMETLERTALPTLLIGPNAKPLVDAATGALRLESVLFPLALSPSPVHAVRNYKDLLGHISPRLHFVHVEEDAETADGVRALFPDVTILKGEVIPALLDAARQTAADLIVMPTAGRRGFMDALRGSTTQRMLREAYCPILALPSE